MFAITSIDPADSFNAEETPVVIVGDGFDEIAEVFVGPKVLADVKAKSPNVLNATVPKGMSAGVYDVKVFNKRGQSLVLSKAFTVNEGTRVRMAGCGCNVGGFELLGSALVLLAAARRRRL